MSKKKRVVVEGIEHGFSGYTNYDCRCDVCRAANTEHSRQYRARRFAGNPLCIVPGCDQHQSQAYGNHLCLRHAKNLIDLRARHPRKAKRIMAQLGLI